MWHHILEEEGEVIKFSSVAKKESKAKFRLTYGETLLPLLYFFCNSLDLPKKKIEMIAQTVPMYLSLLFSMPHKYFKMILEQLQFYRWSGEVGKNAMGVPGTLSQAWKR